MALNFYEETRKMHLLMHYVRVFIICIYLEPKTKLPGLTGSFLLTQASFGSAFKLLIHRIYSFAVDVSGVAALWQIKSCKNLHFEWKSRMCQAWCSTRSFFFFSPLVAVLPARAFVTPCLRRLVLVGAVVFLVNTACERCSVFLHLTHSQSWAQLRCSSI